MPPTFPSHLFALSGAALLLAAEARSEPPIERLEPRVQGEEQGEPGLIAPGSTAHVIQEAILAGALQDRLSGVSDGTRVAARRAYALRVFDPIWTREGARSLLSAFDDAEAVGLSIAPGLRQAVSDQVQHIGAQEARRAGEADLVLTAAFLAYADARINGATEPENVADPLADKTSPERLGLWLARAGEGRLDHSELDPGHAEFARLTELRAHYADHAGEGGWTRLEPPGTLVEAGEREPVITDLRTRLAEEGYEVPAPPMRTVEADAGEETREEPDDTLFTEALSEVLKQFQADRGLKQDGILGPRTLDALNATPQDLIARIDANLERWRWAPARDRRGCSRGYGVRESARAYENGEIAVEMKAIVGLASRKTPIVFESIEYLVANPRWYVPESILERDKLDDIRANPDYIESHDYFVLDRDSGARVPAGDIDWSAADVEEEYRLVQESGEENALGELKFIFPNRYSIYLHGTPAQHLFTENLRSFSSGCVRIEKPLEMSDWIASHDPELTPQEVREAVAGEELQRLELGEPVAIYTVYFTAEAGPDGDARLHPDIYGWDAETIAALEARPVALSEETREGGAQ